MIIYKMLITIVQCFYENWESCEVAGKHKTPFYHRSMVMGQLPESRNRWKLFSESIWNHFLPPAFSEWKWDMRLKLKTHGNYCHLVQVETQTRGNYCRLVWVEIKNHGNYCCLVWIETKANGYICIILWTRPFSPLIVANSLNCKNSARTKMISCKPK